MAAVPDFQIVELDHIVLRVKDVERAIEFYTGTLGLAPHRLEEFRAGEVPFPCARVNDHTLIDLLPSPDEEPIGDGPRNLDHFCERVDTFDEEEIRRHLARFDVVGSCFRSWTADAVTCRPRTPL